MQHRDANHVSDSASRLAVICALVRDLRAANGQSTLSLVDLQTAGKAWEPILRGIATGYLSSREEFSLFEAAAASGYNQAGQVRNLFEATYGSEMRVEANDQRLDERDMREYANDMAQARQDIRGWLAMRGA